MSDDLKSARDHDFAYFEANRDTVIDCYIRLNQIAAAFETIEKKVSNSQVRAIVGYIKRQSIDINALIKALIVPPLEDQQTDQIIVNSKPIDLFGSETK